MYQQRACFMSLGHKQGLDWKWKCKAEKERLPDSERGTVSTAVGRKMSFFCFFSKKYLQRRNKCYNLAN